MRVPFHAFLLLHIRTINIPPSGASDEAHAAEVAEEVEGHDELVVVEAEGGGARRREDVQADVVRVPRVEELLGISAL